jgi:hypothetical protein
MTMLAFHNDPKVRQDALDRAKGHREADELVQGQYWDSGKGCFVGCTVRDMAGVTLAPLTDQGHSLFPTILGVPEQLAWLGDELFEMQTQEDSLLWPERILNAIPLGADLSGVRDRWSLWILMDETWGIFQIAHESKAVVCAMGELFRRATEGDEPTKDEWDRAARAARVAWATRAAWAARDAWAARAARAAWDAWNARAAWDTWAAWDAWDARAAWAAWAARDARDAKDASWTTAACDELIRLLEIAPVPTLIETV